MPEGEPNIHDDTTLQLNQEQEQIVTGVMAALDDSTSSNEPKARTFFLDGPGGTGKTTVYNRLISTFLSKGLKVIKIIVYCLFNYLIVQYKIKLLTLKNCN